MYMYLIMEFRNYTYFKHPRFHSNKKSYSIRELFNNKVNASFKIINIPEIHLQDPQKIFRNFSMWYLKKEKRNSIV